MKKLSQKKIKEIEALVADHEKWDDHLGLPEYSVALSEEECRAIDKGLGFRAISLRLDKTLIDQFKELARLGGIGYQPLMRDVLTEYAKANEHRLVALLPASEAAQRADKLFMAAIRLRDEIIDLAPLSTERVHAESSYNAMLSQARTLFSRAFDSSKNPVVLQHAKLRLQQIAELCKQELQPKPARRNGRTKKAV
ncbi:MAG: hypothetical protein IT342_23030 [Candidatus Melainabacteria bacterium]|nr:hypothetical protein [Candidatus Melainabacteria bacterium]